MITEPKNPTCEGAGNLLERERGDQQAAWRILDPGHGRGPEKQPQTNHPLQPDHGPRRNRRPLSRPDLLPLHAVRRYLLPQGAEPFSLPSASKARYTSILICCFESPLFPVRDASKSKDFSFPRVILSRMIKRGNVPMSRRYLFVPAASNACQPFTSAR